MQVLRTSSSATASLDSGDEDSYALKVSDEREQEISDPTYSRTLPTVPPLRSLSVEVLSPRKPTHPPLEIVIATLPPIITPQEILAKQAILFKDLLARVPDYKVNVKMHVGRPPHITIHNNYGVTPDPDTKIIKTATKIEYTAGNTRHSVPLENAHTDFKQVFSLPKTAILADAAKTIGQENGYQCFIIADGCNLGERPQRAAQLATQICSTTIKETLDKTKKTTTKAIAELALTALQKTHDALIEAGHDTVGETTVTIGVVVKKRLIVASVGDSKVFLLRKDINGALHCFDLTKESRSRSESAKDPGGRLGPPKADWRNLAICVVKLEPGDIYIGASDGAHDNFSPETLETPRTLKINEEKWRAASVNYLNLELCSKLASVVSGNEDRIGEAVLEKVKAITQKSNQFMIDNPRAPLPADIKEFPGKSDHFTLVDGVYQPLKKKKGSLFSK